MWSNDDARESGLRNIKVALPRRSRADAADELDLDHSSDCTAAIAGVLDSELVAARHNNAKVQLLMAGATCLTSMSPC